MFRVHAIASEDRKSRGVHNDLVSQLTDIIAQKLQVVPPELEQHPEEDINLSLLAHLTRVSPEVWKELPKHA